MCSETLVLRFKEKVRRYLNIFVLSLSTLYGEESQAINMHNLCHIVDDVDNFGCDLSKINCFLFENHLAAIKRLIRTPNQPLVQFCRRKSEYNRVVSLQPQSIPSKYKIQQRIKKQKVVIVEKLFLNYATTVTANAPNNIVLMKNGTVAVIKAIIIMNNKLRKSCYYIEATTYKKKIDAFSYLTKSSKVHVWKLLTKSSIDGIYPVTDVDRKLISLKLALQPNGTVRTYVLSLLHA